MTESLEIQPPSLTWMRGNTPLHAAHIDIEIPFHDVDILHIAWHGHYWKYFELARTELFRKLKLDVPDMIELGYAFVVIDVQCRHVQALKYGERARVSAWVLASEDKVEIAYDITSLEGGHRVARAKTTLVTMSGKDRAMLFETPDIIRTRLRTAP